MTSHIKQIPANNPVSARYTKLFSPESIAVIGASNDLLKPGGRVTKNIKENGYTGLLWAVNPKADSVLGLPTYPTIEALPKSPDLAILAIPSKFVLPALEELANRKTGAVIVLTSGFGEKDEAGKKVEHNMLKIANGAGMTLIGPNCSGFLTHAYKGKFAGIIPTLPGQAVDFISGSGATVDYVMERASTRGLSFGTVLNLGNSLQMGVEDLLAVHDENYGPDSASILMVYMEAVNKPAKLLRHARSLVSKGCVLVGIKSGATAAGEKAAASHTGAMATNDTAVQALFEKSGIIRVQGRGDLINVACVLAAAKGRIAGKRICIVTDAGGPGVMLSDELNRQGLELPQLQEQTRAELSKILPPESSTLNPIDALPSRSAEQIKEIIRVLRTFEGDHIDVITVLLGDSGLSDNAPIYREISKVMQTGPIPVIPMFSSVVSSRLKIADFIDEGNVFFPDEVELGQALGKVINWVPPETCCSIPEGYDHALVAEALEGHEGILDPEVVSQVLRAAGFRISDQTEVFEEQHLRETCRKMGYPLVMKVIGPLHKTDVGGVKLDITDDDMALAAWNDLLGIDGAKGVLLQPVIRGQEVILGACREGDFGHLVMFGLGGIYAEVLKDVTFALAPLSRNESLKMIRGIQSYPVLNGFRGEVGMNMDVLADTIQRLGRLVSDFGQIREIDLNPIKGFDSDLFVVDARIIVHP
ncbi:MAG: acetate--CoA ligase family protein [Proteobacteria bacterium]|nr:acetate--CoA ligase family protein [Pseudomonadota bacterium]